MSPEEMEAIRAAIARLQALEIKLGSEPVEEKKVAPRPPRKTLIRRSRFSGSTQAQQPMRRTRQNSGKPKDETLGM